MKINIYDEDLNRVLIIGNQFVSCLWSEGYNTTQSFTLELQDTEEYRNKLKTDYYVGRDDRRSLMVIKSVEISNGKIIASGMQATRVLDDVAFVGTINSNSNIDTTIKEKYNNSSKFNKINFADTNLNVKYDLQISNKSFLQLCETACQATDLGFKAERNGNSIVISFYKPEENQNLIFSEKFGNLTVDSVISATEKLKNYAIVLGGGKDESRTRIDVDMTGGGTRRELIIDARDIQKEDEETQEEYNGRLRARGAEKLLEQKGTLECAFSPVGSDFGKRYDLGDIITVDLMNYGIRLKSRIAKFTQKEQGNTTEMKIEVGNITIIKRGI